MRARAAVMVVAALGACGSEPGPSQPYQVGRSAGVTIVTKLPEAELRLSNHNLGYGSFFVANGCLQVRFEGTVFTPVLPRGSTVAPGGESFMVGSSRIRIGPLYALPSAGEIRDTTMAATAIGVPSRCAQRLLTMGMPIWSGGTSVPSGVLQKLRDGRDPAGQSRASLTGGGGGGGGTIVIMVAPGSA